MYLFFSNVYFIISHDDISLPLSSAYQVLAYKFMYHVIYFRMYVHKSSAMCKPFMVLYHVENTKFIRNSLYNLYLGHILPIGNVGRHIGQHLIVYIFL